MASSSVQLTSEQVLQLVGCFAAIDINGDGTLDQSEIDVFLTQAFPTAPMELLAQVRQIILIEGDRNGDGRIDISEFIDLIKARREEALSMMAYADASGAGAAAAGPVGASVDASVADGMGLPPPTGGADQDAVTSELLNDVFTYLTPEEMDMLRDCFIHLDRNGDGFLDRAEIMDGVAAVIGPERLPSTRQYLDKIFEVADKDVDGRLSLTEFLASFAEGPGAVPHEVVMTMVSKIRVRLTDEDIFNLQESFKCIDRNGDGYVDRQELLAALKLLLHDRYRDITEEAFEEIVGVVMATADSDRDGRLNLAEFIRSFQEDQGVLPNGFINFRGGSKKLLERKLSPEEIGAIRAAFETMDRNSDGYIDYEELYNCLTEALSRSLDPDDVKQLVDAIMSTADKNKDGRISLAEFVRSYLNDEEMMSIPVAAAHEKRQRALARFEEIVENGDLRKLIKVFQALDANHDGYLQQVEVIGAIRAALDAYYPDLSPQKAQLLADAILQEADANEDGQLSLEEFVQSFIQGFGVLPMEIVREVSGQIRRILAPDELAIVYATFQAMDKDGDGFVSRAELFEAMKSALQPVGWSDERVAEVTAYIMSRVDLDADGRLSIREFALSFECDQDLLPTVDTDPSPETTEATTATSQVTAAPIAEIVPLGETSPTREAPPPATSSSTAVVPVPAPMTPSPVKAGRQVAVADDDRSPITNDVSGCCITEGQLRREFAKYDVNGSQSLSKEEFKKVYMGMEFFGLPPKDAEFERDFKKFCGRDDVITYDEFCLFMLRRSRM